MSKRLHLYKIYHIPSTTWLLALADTKYNTVLELPSEFFTLCSSRMDGPVWRYDNRVRLDFDDDTFTHTYCYGRSTCTKCVISNVELSSSEVVVYWSELPRITNHLLHLLGARGPDEDSLIRICMHLRRGDIELDTWTELPYKE